MVFPKEGPVLWVDTLAIPATAKNPEGAHKLINYMLGKKTAEKLTLAIGYPTSNIEAKKALPKEITEDPAIYPSADILKIVTGKMTLAMQFNSMNNIIKN